MLHRIKKIIILGIFVDSMTITLTSSQGNFGFTTSPTKIIFGVMCPPKPWAAQHAKLKSSNLHPRFLEFKIALIKNYTGMLKSCGLAD